MRPGILVIVGPTASGKKKLALKAAEMFNGEIVSADSRKVYRYLDIGTAKPSPDERKKLPHHLIDIIDPDEPFSAGEWVRLAGEAVRDILSRGKVPVISGGTGFYITAFREGLSAGISPDMETRTRIEQDALGKSNNELWDELNRIDPERASNLNSNDRMRVLRALEINLTTGMPFAKLRDIKKPEGGSYDYFVIGAFLERTELYRRINDRTDIMVKQGLVDEVRKILEMGYSRDIVALDTVGYREWFPYLDGEKTFDQCIEDVKRNTRRYAKRQMTWFRAVKDTRWINMHDDKEIECIIHSAREWLVQRK